MSTIPTRFNSKLPARPESVEVVMKVLCHNDELMVKDIARLGRLTHSQARRALEELVASDKVVVRKLQRPHKTLYRLRVKDQG
jgi:predicted ArsR family transcriptional regulator